MTPESSGANGAESLIPRASDIHATLGPAEAAILETFVVPRYLSLYGDIAVGLIVQSEDARVIHLNCRTGYPERGIAERLKGAHIIGVDRSRAAIELARAKASTIPGLVSTYVVSDNLETTLPSAAFSHALTLHPTVRAEQRHRMLAEIGRLLAPYGQAIVALPARGSFQELMDLFREYALKFDDVDFAHAVERASTSHPTVEMMSGELAGAGFDFVDVELRPTTLRFQSGRDFFEDPVTRILIVPDLQCSLGLEDISKPLDYVREAIDKYWSDGTFELSIHIACATGRRMKSSG